MSYNHESIKNTNEISEALFVMSNRALKLKAREQAATYRRGCGNERDIEFTAKSLRQKLEDAKGRIEKALQNLDNDQVSSLNSCGILQGLSAEIDSEMTKLKTMLNNRGFYAQAVDIQ